MATRPHAIPAVAAATLLLVALGQHPYSYYTFLRWAVCAAAAFVAWLAWHSTAEWATWLFVGIAILFNPLVPIYMTRAHWRPVDILCATVFAASLALSFRAEGQPERRA